MKVQVKVGLPNWENTYANVHMESPKTVVVELIKSMKQIVHKEDGPINDTMRSSYTQIALDCGIENPTFKRIDNQTMHMLKPVTPRKPKA